MRVRGGGGRKGRGRLRDACGGSVSARQSCASPHDAAPRIAVSRSIAITIGPAPACNVRRSSPNVTALTSCSPFSIPRWVRSNVSRRAASATAGDKRVMAYRTAICVSPAACQVRSIIRQMARCQPGVWVFARPQDFAAARTWVREYVHPVSAPWDR